MFLRPGLFVKMLCVFMMLGIVNCSSEDPCDVECQKRMYEWFRNLHQCSELCNAQAGFKSEFYLPIQRPGEQPQKVTLTGADCGRCNSAYKAWTAGKDCDEPQRRCALSFETPYPVPLLQICTLLNNRFIWTLGRECHEKDGYPCVNLSSGPTCWGCKDQKDCDALQDTFDKSKLTCDTGKKRCFNCDDKKTCSNFRRCDDRKCVGCTEDSHCVPEMTGTMCTDDFHCVCLDDEICQQAGFLSCGVESGRCRPCEKDDECTELFDEGAKCQAGRCRSACDDDSHCEHYRAAVCEGGLCAFKKMDCTKDADCQRFSKDGKCHEGRCSRQIGASCKDSSECQRLGKGSTCVSGKCARPGGTGFSCKSDADCKKLGNQGLCTDGKCTRMDQACTNDDTCKALNDNLKCNQGRCSFDRGSACKSDSECTKDGKKGKCKIGRCVYLFNCRTDADCKKLNPSAACKLGRCVKPIECKVSSECKKIDSKAECKGGRCVKPGGCTDHFQCTKILRTPFAKCDPTDRKCKSAVPPCRDNEFCKKLMKLSSATCEEQVCISNKPCKAAIDCRKAGMGIFAVCKEGQCQRGSLTCKSDGDCAPNFTCRNGTCVQKAGHCLSDQYCKPFMGPGGKCVAGACQSAHKCTSSTLCQQRFGATAICKSGFCLLENNCKATADCKMFTSAARCEKGICLRGPPPPCRSTSECQAKYRATTKCGNGRCLPTHGGCKGDLDCHFTRFCARNGNCVNRGPCNADGPCRAKMQTPSAKCIDSRCYRQ